MSARRRRRAGFTLVEVMVAMTLGALVIASVYTLGGGASRDFQAQQRITQLQLATRLALDRVRRDVERAGLHGTPDSMAPAERLGANPPRRIVAVRLQNDASRAAIDAHQAGSDNTTTQGDVLTLVGNFVTSDAYLVRSLNDVGDTVFLQTGWQGFRRSFVVVDGGSERIDEELFARVFRSGRMLHLQTITGNHFFVTVVGASVAGDNATVRFTPAIGVGGTSVVGLAEGALVAPLAEIQYGLEANAPDIPQDPDSADLTGPNVSLVRRELDMANGTVIPGSTRTVLEWAVHFDVDAILDDTEVGMPPSALSLNVYDDRAAEEQVAARPSRVRALVVTVGARTREQDRRFPWVEPTDNGPLVRFRVFNDRVGAAHVRTATAEIGLPNLINRGL